MRERLFVAASIALGNGRGKRPAATRRFHALVLAGGLVVSLLYGALVAVPGFDSAGRLYAERTLDPVLQEDAVDHTGWGGVRGLDRNAATHED